MPEDGPRAIGRLRPPSLVSLIVAITLVTSSCAVNGLAFVRDRRIDIETPTVNEKVTFPFEVTWTADGYDGSYAVFFDRSPMRPDQSLRSVVAEDDPCRRMPGCPDEAWLNQRYIFVTDEPRLVIENLPDLRPSKRGQDRHDLTIVLLDEHGRRVGESAFTREFIVERSR